MTVEPPIDDSYLREDEEEAFDEMVKVRDDLIEALSPLQRAALFQDFHEFCLLYQEELTDKYYDSLS